MATYIIEIYSLDVSTGTFTRIDAIDTYQNLSFTNRLNGIGRCSFRLSIYDPKANQANLKRFINQIVIKRDTEIVYVGPITSVALNFADIDGEVSVESQSSLYHFKTRYTSKIKQYVNTDQSDILWDLIDTTQTSANGNLGITRGLSESGSTSRDRTYEYSEIAQAIINMSNIIGGMDFDFSYTQDSDYNLTGIEFNTYYPIKGSYRTELPKLMIDKNVKVINTQTTQDIFNTYTLEGSGTGESVILYATSDSTSQTDYTRRENVSMQKDISIYDTLVDKGTALLNFFKVENQGIELELYPDIKPTFEDLSLGDIHYVDLTLSGSGGYLDIDSEARLWSIEVNIDQQGVEVIRPKFMLVF